MLLHICVYNKVFIQSFTCLQQHTPAIQKLNEQHFILYAINVRTIKLRRWKKYITNAFYFLFFCCHIMLHAHTSRVLASGQCCCVMQFLHCFFLFVANKQQYHHNYKNYFYWYNESCWFPFFSYLFYIYSI